MLVRYICLILLRKENWIKRREAIHTEITLKNLPDLIEDKTWDWGTQGWVG